MPKNSKAKIAANNRNTKNHYDRLYPFVPKGRKAEIQAAADAQSESLNDFVVKAIEERMEKQKSAPIRYAELYKQMESILGGETDVVANLSNAAALLNSALTKINWVGFYLMKNGELLIGPFQGPPACVHIAIGRGVCGTAVMQNAVQSVPDVRLFRGHIACDSHSISELVVPMRANGKVVGVLDIDSPVYNRFEEDDVRELGRMAELIAGKCRWPV
jgi:GAF domain-containing protein